MRFDCNVLHESSEICVEAKIYFLDKFMQMLGKLFVCNPNKSCPVVFVRLGIIYNFPTNWRRWVAHRELNLAEGLLRNFSNHKLLLRSEELLCLWELFIELFFYNFLESVVHVTLELRTHIAAAKCALLLPMVIPSEHGFYALNTKSVLAG